nr:MAG TPA: hypothetical protein [Caudoviricetes sp.]
MIGTCSKGAYGQMYTSSSIKHILLFDEKLINK